MKWLFLLVMFDLSASAGGFRPKIVLRAVFPTEEACNTLGRDFEKSYTYENPSMKSFSICIPESAYADRGMNVINVD